MTDQERTILRALYDLHGDEIEALRKANESLRKSHDAIGQRLTRTNDDRIRPN